MVHMRSGAEVEVEEGIGIEWGDEIKEIVVVLVWGKV